VDASTSALVDIHSHLVPGVDDGARDVAAVLDSVRRMREAGVGRIVTTPHIRGALSADRGALEARLDEVSDAWSGAAGAVSDAFPDVEYLRGHEVLLDVPEVDVSDSRMRMAGTRFVLVEWPRLNIPPGSLSALRSIVASGYRPIVAHPERYQSMGQQLELAYRWRMVGALLQINLGSLVGRYGSQARTVAYRLLRRGWADYMASDFHGHASMPLYYEEARGALEELRGHELMEYLCSVNPSRMLADEEPLPPPPLVGVPSLWSKMKRAVKKPHA